MRLRSVLPMLATLAFVPFGAAEVGRGGSIPAGALEAAATGDAVEAMSPMLVTATRVSATEIEGPQAIDHYDAQHIESTGAFSVEEFIANLPSPEEGTTQIVLIDGRPTYLDPNSLPIGMIAAIEVSNEGSMPQYGAFNNGRIINIQLKKDYASREIGAKFTGTFDGGGSRRTARFAGAVNRDALRIIYSLELTGSRPLLASDRDFSRNQDFRDRGGRDLRLAWGAPAVVVSQSGPLAGLPGDVLVALVPSGSTGADLTPAHFLPADPALGPDAANQRRFNTADYRWLASPTQRTSLNLGFTYTFNERLQFSINGSHVDTRGKRMGPPPVTPVSTLTRVPAAFNPFGQDVAIGLVHIGFGPTRRDSRSRRDQIGLEFNGKLGGDWQWEASTGHRRDRSEQSGAELDPAKFSASLRAADPSVRFNPFADDARFATNTALYPSLISMREGRDRSSRTEAELTVKGPAFQLKGGPAQVRLEAEVDDSTRERLTTRTLGEDPESSRRSELSRQLSAVITLPFISSRNSGRLARRLETQLAGEVDRSSDGGREWDAETGVVWAPAKSVLLRARYQHSVETPSRGTTAGSEILVGETLIDARRGGEPITDVRAFIRETVVAEPEVSGRYSIGVTLEPATLPGLRLNASYRVRRQEQILQSRFNAQEIINNEGSFAGRVLRAALTTGDLAAGRPGTIEAVDLTPGNTGEAEHQEMEYEVTYRPPEGAAGRWRFTASAEHNLRSSYEVLPGVPFVSDGGGRYHRPRWRFDGQLSWSRGPWNASARSRHTGAIKATSGARNGVKAHTTVDLTAGYRCCLQPREARTRDVMMTVGVGNLFDAPPPFADNVSGYRGGSPLGRTYSAALKLEF